MSFSFDDQVDCALVNGGSIRIDDQLEGDINAVDVFRILPYGGAVLKVEIKGRLLKRVLDYGVLAAGTGAYLQRFNARKIGEKWMIQNKELNNRKTYTVAFSDYLLKGFDIPFLSIENKEVLSVYKPEKNELAFDIRKAVFEYLRKQKN
jgi:5'-nucleotidase/UDP-sugar diphosphatase